MKTINTLTGRLPEIERIESKSSLGLLRIVSWNLLHTTGAVVEDIAALIDTEHPDLLFMQEATEAIGHLPELAGGVCYHQAWPERHHGLTVWAAQGLENTHAVFLPKSHVPGGLPQRVAQVVEIDGVTIANVHLSHGQVLNRMQLRKIARSTRGPTAIVGDFNALGPIVLKDFVDAGPRGATHQAQDLLPFRLDRCMVRGLMCDDARLLDRGASDHRPIAMTLRVSS